jgi:rubredoxin-NAD+ reductase
MAPVIIIGAGLAGWTTAREFRKLDATTPLMLISADNADFYAKPSLSNALTQGRTPERLVTTPAAKMAEQQTLTLLADTQVTAIDPQTHRITTSAGQFEYSRLVLATGAQPIRLPLDGDASAAVLAINSLNDFARFHAQLNAADPAHKKSVLIMGAGLIGCEFANDLAAAGHPVTVVDPSTGPISGLLPAEAGAQIRAALAGLGVVWHFGATVKAVNLVAGSAALEIELSNGQRCCADIVLSAIGLRADIALAQAGGIACDRAILVDPYLQTSCPDIYALGDSAQYASAGNRALPFVMPIMTAAKALAATLAGQATELLFPLMPVGIKTPALPTVVSAPAPGTVGDWRQVEEGLWQFIDAAGMNRGFVLTGAQTARRMEQVKLVQA